MQAFDAVIVGAGPAGVSCGIWLQQLGFTSALVDRNASCGGLQLSNPWTNTWIATSVRVLGADITRALHESAMTHGCSLHMGRTAQSATRSGQGWRIALDDGAVLQGRCLVLAGGVVPRTGGLLPRAALLVGPGPEVAKTDFHCARVAILGGGDNAFENYQFVEQKGATSVHLYARTIRARAEMLEKVPPQNVFEGPFTFDQGALTVNGRAYDQVLAFFGYEANRRSLLGLEPAMQPSGFVQTDATCRTSLPGVWAIGELARRAHPCCVTSMADGVVAAKDIQQTLESSRAAQCLAALRRGAGLMKKLAQSG